MKKINWKTINDDASAWILNYAKQYGLKSLVIGISGGIDSAVVSYLCAKTGLKVYVVSMPIRQPLESLGRATRHIEWLKNQFDNVESLFVDLTEIFELSEKTFTNTLGIDNKLCSANLRSRLRMNTLYHVACDKIGIVVGTGNKVEDYGIGFFTKYGDGGVDISPIGGFMKSEVYEMARAADINEEIIAAKPTDDLWAGGTTDEQQIGATYDELEWAMGRENVYKFKPKGREKEVIDIYTHMHERNQHKMDPIPIFDADECFVRQIGYRPTRQNLNEVVPEY
jgi:NAD+ synthase